MNNQLPADIFIKAAADLSGRDPGQLDAREALHILQEYGRHPVSNVYRLDDNEQEPASDLYRQLTDDAANELFSDPQHAAEWADVVKEWDGETPDLLALTLQHDLSPLIRAKARKMYDDLPQDDPQRQELENIMITPALSPEMQEALNSVFSMQNSVAEAMRPMLEGIEAASQIVKQLSEGIQAAVSMGNNLSKLFPTFAGLQESISNFLDNNPAYILFDEITGDLAPYIEEELKKPQYEGKTIEELWEEAQATDDGLFSESSLLMQAVNAAREAAGEFLSAVKEEPAGELIATQKAPEHQTIAEMSFTTDRLPYIFFGGSLPTPAREDVPGQLSFTPIKEQYSGGGHTESFIYWHYFIDEATFEKLGLSKVYDYEDYFILCVLFTERVLGNTVISPTALYRDVYGKDPSDNDIETFRKRLQKLDATRIYINNHDLMQTWKGADPNATFIEGLYHLINIDFTIERYLFNGKVAKETIRIGEVPALLQIGADLNRMTKIPKSAFYVVDYKTGNRVRSTSRYWHALIYLTRRIAQMKNGSGETKILYDTLYSELKAKKAREKQLTREVVFKILEHWRRIGWIKSYKEETTKSTGKVGIKIVLPGNAITAKKRQQITQKKGTKTEKKS